GRHGIDLVVGQRLRLRVGHRPPDEVEQRGGIGPEIHDGLTAVERGARRPTDQRGAVPALAVLAMTEGAFLRVDRSTLGGRATAGRKTGAVRHDVDVPGSKLARADRLAEFRTVGTCRGGGYEEKRSGTEQELTRRHA